MFTPAKISERVSESILGGRLVAGERLGEQPMADLFGVSRTVVREALIRLQARGFVEVRPRLGWYVASPTWEDAREACAARRIVEPGMLRAADRPAQPVIRRLRQHLAIERQQIGDCATRHKVLADFHILLAECLGGRLLTAMMVELVARTALVTGLQPSAAQAQEANDDHAAVVEALAEGDMAAAESLMGEHLDLLAARLDESMFRAGNAPDRLARALVGDAAAVAGQLAA